MSDLYDCGDPRRRATGLTRARSAVGRGKLVVVPTDTVYGIGADAFDAEAVRALLDAKGRGRDVPPPVLVPHPDTLHGLAIGIGSQVRSLVAAFWPGALTIVMRAQPSLQWDLGDTGGTVALRMPLHPVTLELLERTGPMAVSSANRTGQRPATTCGQAREQLGDAVTVYLDAGPSGDEVPSTIVDTTVAPIRVLRVGAVPLTSLRDVVATIEPPSSREATGP